MNARGAAQGPISVRARRGTEHAMTPPIPHLAALLPILLCAACAKHKPPPPRPRR